MRASGRPTGPSLPCGATVATALLMALAIGTASPVMASGVSAHATARFAGRAGLSAVSCRGASWCMAVGGYTDRSHVRHALAQIWNGRSWRVLKNPPGTSLTSVSCSARWFCMAAGGPTGAERWNGKTWRQMPGPKGGVAGVSCGSRRLCMAIHGGIVRAWNGTRWRLQAKTSLHCSGGPPGPCGQAAVSCGSATNCVAVGTQTISQEPVQDAVAAEWNGTTWSSAGPPAYGNPAAMNAISCAGAFCLAAGGAYVEADGGDLAIGDAWHAPSQSWADMSPSLGTICHVSVTTCAWADSVSCASATSCMTFGPAGNQAWNGTTWKAAPSISAGRGSSLRAVSCGGTVCLAVGYRTIAGVRRTLAELWNGTAWKILPAPKLT